MDKISTIVNSAWFSAALAGAAGVGLLIKGEILFAGIAFGVGAREFLFAFKS